MIFRDRVEVMVGDQVIDEGLAELDTFEYEDNIYGYSTFCIKMISVDHTAWDDVIRSNVNWNDVPVRVRWGMEVSEGEDVWSEWRKVSVGNPEFRFTLGGVEVDLVGTCGGSNLSDRYGQRVYKDQTISSMVRDIAEDNGMDADVTDTAGKYTFYQCLMSDSEFVQNELVPHAVSPGGRTDFVFYVRNGDTLVFKVLDFGEVVHRFDCLANQASRDLTTVYESRFYFRPRAVEDDAGGDLVLRQFDPYRKEVYSFRANDDTVPYPKLAPVSPTPSEAPSAVMMSNPAPADQFRQADVENMAKSVWGMNARSLFRAVLVVPFLPLAIPGTVVELVMKDNDGRELKFGGKWLVYAVKQQKRSDEPETILYLERRTVR